ncbi:TonB-dependent receptor [bacterium]|nr:TonB-dependent receptor [bacterium]
MKTKKSNQCPISLTALTILLLLLGKNAIPASENPVPEVPPPIDPSFATPEKPGTETASPEEPAAPTMAPEPSLDLMLLDQKMFVVTATKRLQKLTEVPGSVTVISEQEIKEKGCLTLKEVLTNFTAVDFFYEGIFEVMRFRGIQSPYNNKILFLINGRKINTVDWNSYPYHFGFNLDNIKQIEIIKGPGSSLYGANAYAGVINIITKQGADLDGLNLKLSPGYNFEAEAFSQYYLLSYGKKAGETDYLVSTSYWRQWDIDVLNRNTPNNLYSGQRIDLSLTHQQALKLCGGYHKMEDPYPGHFHTPTPRNKNFQETAYLDAKYTWTLDELSHLSFRAEDTYYPYRWMRQLNYNLNRTKIDSPADLPTGLTGIYYDDGTLPAPPENALGGYYIDISSFDGTTDKFTGGSMNEFLAEIQYDLAWPNHNYLILGLSFTHDWFQGNYFSFETVFDRNYAVYLQDEYHLGDNLILLGGARYDFNTQYGASHSPRGSLIYSPLPNLRFKTLYGQAFRSPAMVELYSQENFGIYEIRGKADLIPEKIEQSEASIEYELGKWLQVKGGYFYWQTSDEIQPSYASSPLYLYFPDMSQINPALPAAPGLYHTQSLNIVPSRITWANRNSRIGHGLEIESSIRFSSYFKLRLNYTGFQLYSRLCPMLPTWTEGHADILNGILGFNYENRFFANFYAHIGRSPQAASLSIQTTSKPPVNISWLSQYDLSLGFKHQGLGFTFVILNLFENYIAYDPLHDQRVSGNRIVRLNMEYTYNF